MTSPAEDVLAVVAEFGADLQAAAKNAIDAIRETAATSQESYALAPPQPGTFVQFSPTEPTGSGYIHIALDLGNGAQTSAKRSPNGIWWWEALPASGPDHMAYGAWADLLDHYGRTRPPRVVRLVAVEDIKWPDCVKCSTNAGEPRPVTS